MNYIENWRKAKDLQHGVKNIVRNRFHRMAQSDVMRHEFS